MHDRETAMNNIGTLSNQFFSTSQSWVIIIVYNI